MGICLSGLFLESVKIGEENALCPRHYTSCIQKYLCILVPGPTDTDEIRIFLPIIQLYTCIYFSRVAETCDMSYENE